MYDPNATKWTFCPPATVGKLQTLFLFRVITESFNYYVQLGF